MDHRGWLLRRKSSEKNPDETDSPGSASPHSENYSDDQEAPRSSPNNASVDHAQSSEVSSSTYDGEVNQTVKRLTEKLSAALLNISAKEDLVNQHAKVAEDAVSGWEQAESEVAVLKHHLEIALQNQSALEEKNSQLDEALKECVKQLHQLKEDREEKTCEWESEKHELEKQLMELKAQLQAGKTDHVILDCGLQTRVEAVEKENTALKIELHSQSEDLQVLLLERELSNKAAETASKQHSESIKKVTKLEAECHRLQSINRRLSSVSDHKPIVSSVCVGSSPDCQSDSRECLFGIDSETGCSDSWASSLIAELDQFKCEKARSRYLNTSVEIELMDDFLEMERLVALPEIDHGNLAFNPETQYDQVVRRVSPPKIKNEIMNKKIVELEEKVEWLEHEKAELEIALSQSHNQQLEISCNLLAAAKNKIVELQTKIDLSTSEVMDLEGKRKELETELESAHLENGKLCEKVSFFQESFAAERVSSAEFKARIEIAEAATQALDSQLKSAQLEISNLKETVGLIECQVKEGRALSSALTAKKEALEATGKAMASQLEHANSEVRRLREKVRFWELKAEEKTKLAAEFAIQVEAAEATRKKLEVDLKSAHEFATKVDAAEAAKKTLEIQLASAHMDVVKLSGNVVLLEGKIEEERASSAEFAARCHKLEGDLLRMKREADVWRVAKSNREIKIKQEKELAMAAGKLEECQKTIASLNRQLKSLTTLDDFMIGDERPEHNIFLQHPSGDEAKDLEIIGGCTVSSGRERSSRQSSSLSFFSSSSSNFSGFMRTLSRSRSITR
ncbi:plant protein [Musa troglodytarum]|uniref:Plant protein n=2 Tax=Musa troglodytarum TaxID=320322 RepID=A0A9E7KM46_9LILI|nr:plant protein [Musa troglodytarum]